MTQCVSYARAEQQIHRRVLKSRPSPSGPSARWSASVRRRVFLFSTVTAHAAEGFPAFMSAVSPPSVQM